MTRIMVAGSGTHVGKTLVSAILAQLFNADYWKPIQCGEDDTERVKKLLGRERTYPPVYSFKTSLSPHHAARLGKVAIDCSAIYPPQTDRHLVIEGVGGILVPLTTTNTSLDLFHSWKCQWILVSRHYLGSINHTLLSIEALKQRQIPVLGIIFNGQANPDTERAILEISKIPLLGRLRPERKISSKTLLKYVKEWKSLTTFT